MAIASAAALTPGTDGNLFHITGTTGMTSIASIDGAGPIWLIYDDAVVITHNATSLILIGGANYTTVAGDVLCFMHEGSGNYRELFRFMTGSDPVGTAKTQTLTNKTLTTPTISATGFANATHAHAAASSGGTLAHNTATDNPSAAVHGLGASVNVLGNRAAAGEFVQRDTYDPPISSVGTINVYSGTDLTITFTVAFSSSPHVWQTGTTTTSQFWALIHSITTTNFKIVTVAGTSSLDPTSGNWEAMGG